LGVNLQEAIERAATSTRPESPSIALSLEAEAVSGLATTSTREPSVFSNTNDNAV
jgi:hypothetical protein